MAFVGGGNMAEALIKGLLGSETVSPERITVSDVNQERLAFLHRQYRVITTPSNQKAVEQADVVWLCVKPQQMPELLADLQPASPTALFVSIAAGVTTSSIETALGGSARVVRVMPNTPALVGQGAAGLAAGSAATPEDVHNVKTWMTCVGVAHEVQEEELHAVTALSGSGPAYVFLLMEEMLNAADVMGLSAEISKDLVVQTVMGAGKLFAESELTASELRERVTSKGGTTFAALETFRREGMPEAIVKGVEAAAARSRELSAS